jgi:CheY-like chemotaxis protein
MTAVNGREALAMWERGSFDLILMDLKMPGMDGFEAARSIRDRENPSRPRTPIVAMTAHIREDDQRRCDDAGMNGCVSKQAGVENLYDIVLRHIVE